MGFIPRILHVSPTREPHLGERGAVIIGYKLVNDYPLDPGDQITIGGKKFRVVGILEKIGNQEDDSSINVNVNDLWELTGKKNTCNFIMFTTRVK